MAGPKLQLKALKSLADYQQTFRWVTSFDYQLPFGKGMRWMNQNKALDLILGRLALDRASSR